MQPRPFLIAAVAVLCLGVSSALAQTDPVAEIAGYQGADREQRLAEGAKREKELTLYSSIPPADIAALVAAFDKKYAIKVKVWRSDSEGFLQRVLSEARARRFDVDIMAGASSALEPLYRENLLQEVKSPYLAELVPEAIPSHRQWVAMYFTLFVQAYNTTVVSRDSLPASYEGLLQPQWKGKLGIEADDFDWFGEVIKDLGERRGLQLFRDIVAANGISVRKGHSLINNLIIAGEVPLALSAYGYLAEQSKRKGAPIDWFTLPPAVARSTAEGLARNAPHPNAAVLFYDFLISDAQKVFADRQFLPAHRGIEPPYKVQYKLIDSAAMLDHARKWQDLFQRTIVGPSR
ncbi:MAG TPA: extracellular solute-binding protein [Xanthobacteraceae bacterium]|jgi:iron(III) transport system substrate-binding protein